LREIEVVVCYGLKSRGGYGLLWRRHNFRLYFFPALCPRRFRLSSGTELPRTVGFPHVFELVHPFLGFLVLVDSHR
jgi:hypothetical protein